MADRLAAALLVAHVAMVAWLGFLVPWTADELTYLQAGIALRAELEYSPFETILHGPPALLANQLAAWLGAPLEPLADYKGFGRLGMLPFVALAAFGLWRCARELGGPRLGLAALALHVLNPLLLAHAPLMTPDVALTAAWIWTCWMLVRWHAEPGWARAVVAGIAFGAALATKFLALGLLPAFVAVWWLARTRVRVVPHAAVMALAAWVTLWLGYFVVPPGYTVEIRQTPRTERNAHDTASGVVSDALRRVAALPGLPVLLGTLPEPFVRGIDFQQFFAEQGGAKLGDRREPGFASYYALGLLAKLPLAWLLLLVLATFLRGPPWRAGVGWILAAASVPLFAWLSLATSKQIGVRYVLPLLPLVALVAARPLVQLSRSSRRHAVAAALITLLAVLELAGAWPRPLSWSNAMFRSRAHLWFHDSTCAWPPKYPALSPELWLDPWVPDPDRAALLARHPEAVEVSELSGPRLGPVLAHWLVCGADDPRDPTRLHHWLRGLTPIDREGEWLLFDATPAEWTAARGDDPRARMELGVAMLAAGHVDEARRLLEANPDPDAAAALLLLTPDLAPALQAQIWAGFGRFDRVLALGDAAPAALRARALAQHQRYEEAASLLQQELAAGRGDVPEMLQLAHLLVELHRFADAQALLAQTQPAEAAPLAEAWRSFRRLLATQQQTAAQLQARIGTPRLR